MFEIRSYHKYFALFSFLLFVFISSLTMSNKLERYDRVVILWLEDISSPSVVNLMTLITKFGVGEVILIVSFLIGAFLVLKKMWGPAIFLFLLTFGGILINFILKLLFQRERPGEMSVIEVFGYSLEVQSYSFPSGHTMRSVILLLFLINLVCYLLKNNNVKLTVLSVLYILIFAVALSRIIVGAHFPTDIIAAVMVSISWFIGCMMLIQLIRKRLELN